MAPHPSCSTYSWLAHFYTHKDGYLTRTPKNEIRQSTRSGWHNSQNAQVGSNTNARRGLFPRSAHLVNHYSVRHGNNHGILAGQLAASNSNSAMEKEVPKENKNNWRGVVLLSIGSKLVARLVATRLHKFSESFLDEEQQGFRRNRSVDDVLQVTRRIAEEVCAASAGEAIHLTLYDIEKAYPRVNREALWQILHKRGAPPGFIKLCQGLHEHTKFHIKFNGVTSRPYETDRGLKEGCPSSPPLFNIYHNAVMTDFRARRKRAADQLQLYPGVPWKAIVNGRIKRRRRTFQTDKNSKIHIWRHRIRRRHRHLGHSCRT